MLLIIYFIIAESERNFVLARLPQLPLLFKETAQQHQLIISKHQFLLPPDRLFQLDRLPRRPATRRRSHRRRHPTLRAHVPKSAQ